jgi:beta-glucanase (GH16 family)
VKTFRNLLLLGVGVALMLVGYLGWRETTAPEKLPAPTLAFVEAPRPAVLDSGWRLAFRDEFDGPELDSSRWSTCYHYAVVEESVLRCGLGDAPTGVNEPDNVSILSGTVRLEVAKESRTLNGRSFEHTFGMLSSHAGFTFTHGYAEMRARFPAGKGNWPAFWLMPDSKAWPPEIDVVEWLGREPNVVHGTVHFNDRSGKKSSNSGQFSGPDYSSDFHLYAVRWTPDEIVWYVDGKEFHRTAESVPNEAMYLLLTSGFGAPDSWGGPIDASTPFPNFYVIDYVRVWQQDR